jgi:hypothetical protein
VRHRLRYKNKDEAIAAQVVIACMNTTQIDRLVMSNKRAEGQQMPLRDLLLGLGESPFVPKCRDPSKPVDGGSNRALARMTILCDEDDLTRCPSPKAKVMMANWSEVVPSSLFMKMVARATHNEIPVVVEGENSDSEVEDKDEQEAVKPKPKPKQHDEDKEQLAKLVGHLKTLRSSVFLTLSVTATPAALFPEAEHDYDTVAYHVIILTPPWTYVS